MSLNNFIATVKKKGFTRNNQFNFILTLPPKLVRQFDLNDISLRAFSVNSPSHNFSTMDDFVEIYAERKYVYDQQKGDVNVQFYIDSDFDVVALFNAWKDIIIDKNTRAVGFYDDYVSTMFLDVIKQDRRSDNKLSASYKFDEIYPKSIGEIQFDWTSTNQISILPITFAYRQYSLTTETRSSPEVIVDPTNEVNNPDGLNTASIVADVRDRINNIIA